MQLQSPAITVSKEGRRYRRSIIETCAHNESEKAGAPSPLMSLKSPMSLPFLNPTSNVSRLYYFLRFHSQLSTCCAACKHQWTPSHSRSYYSTSRQFIELLIRLYIDFHAIDNLAHLARERIPERLASILNYPLRF